KEAGTRFAITHGGVGDYALVAEGTDFALVGVEAGKAFFKLTVFGNDLPIYTPYIPRPTPVEKNPNAIARMAPLILRIEEWAYEYEQRNRYECKGGVVVPRVNIGAIRGGVPYKITKTVQQCAIYLDVRVTPVQNPLDVREELRRLMEDAGLAGEVELFAYRPAYEADPEKVVPLTEAITRAHRAVLGSTPRPAAPPFSSMWRDINCFNEMRIPAITYGPGISVGGGNFGMKIADLVTGSQLYALTALELCGQERS
ncbi:MAG TPA: peptidase dimerization domain-containing protein, partial [Candidatus Methylomirabilis sp.]|nr:peptidase dimerization domain-containing protein [Candidatus Methylomirabilis sp.]